MRYERYFSRRKIGRPAALIGVVALTVMSGACSSRSEWDKVRESAGNGDAVRQIQSYFDNHPQCVRVLRPATVPGLMAADHGDSAAQALRQSGLIEKVSSAGDEDRYRPAPAARRWFRQGQTAGVTAHQLCFARRRVSYALVDTTGAAPGLRYGFALDNPAPWMGAAAIKAAFPAVEQAMLASYLGTEKLPFQDGRIKFDRVEPTEVHPTLFAFDVTFK